MKFRRFFVFVCCFMFSALSFSVQAGSTDIQPGTENPNVTVEKKATDTSPSAENETETAGTPSAFAPVTKFEFETALEGAQLTHEFVIQNKGTGTLEISKVKTG